MKGKRKRRGNSSDESDDDDKKKKGKGRSNKSDIDGWLRFSPATNALRRWRSQPAQWYRSSRTSGTSLSEVNVASSDSGDNQAQHRVDPTIDEVQPLISNEYDHQREPYVFRCLSCFSIFMPTGNGFNLFWMFGNKSNEASDQPSQKEVPVKRRWFSKFFASDKVEQGAVQSLDATNSIAGVCCIV